MGKEVPYKPDKICDGCGKAGAFDFYGDYYCPVCCDINDAEAEAEAEAAGVDDDVLHEDLLE